MILLPVAAAAGAAMLIAYAVAPHGASTTGATPSSAAGKAPPAPATPTAAAPAATSATLDARRVLDAAASAVAARTTTATEPAAGQWIYARTVDYEYGQGAKYYDEWITFDGTKTAYYQGSQLIVHQSTAPAATGGGSLAAFWANITPKTAYDALASLPSDPQQLLTVIGNAATMIGARNLAAGNPVAGAAPTTRAQLDFDCLTLLLWNAAGGVDAPPAAEAAAYHALALLPGVTVQEGVRDAAGVPAIAVSVNGGYNQLLLDQISYQVLGLRQLSTGIGPIAAPMDPATLRKLPRPVRLKLEAQAARQRSAWPPKGTVQESLAYGYVAQVSAPGLR